VVQHGNLFSKGNGFILHHMQIGHLSIQSSSTSSIIEATNDGNVGIRTNNPEIFFK
jgi:hypothetical protein